MKSSPLSHFEHVIAMLALIASLAAITLAIRAEWASAAPNIVLVESIAARVNESSCGDTGCSSNRQISALAKLRNAGRASVQIVSIEVEVFAVPIILSDRLKVLVDDVNPPRHLRPELQLVPEKVFWLSDPHINAQSEKTLYFEAASEMQETQLIGLRTRIELSTGQKMTVVPQVIKSRSGASFN